MDRAMLEALEKQFWTGDAAFYDRNLARDALMMFAEPIGVLTRERVVDAVASSPRWGEVSLEQVRFVELDQYAGILSYRARARTKEDGAEYSALVSSVYVQRGGRCWLAFHQQTPDVDQR
jgi:hypothetical protein